MRVHLIVSFSSDYELRGHKISVGMAEKSAPRPPPAQGYVYQLTHYALMRVISPILYAILQHIFF